MANSQTQETRTDTYGARSGETTENSSLFACYDRYVRTLTTADENAVYIGFTLLIGGALLGLVGWVLFFWSESVVGPAWDLREGAFASVGIALPFVLGGMVRIMMAETGTRNVRTLRISATAAIVCLIAMGGFVLAYPSQWNVVGMDYSLPVLTVYGIGFAFLILSIGSAVGCGCAKRILRTQEA